MSKIFKKFRRKEKKKEKFLAISELEKILIKMSVHENNKEIYLRFLLWRLSSKGSLRVVDASAFSDYFGENPQIM